MGSGTNRDETKRQVYEATDLVRLIGEHVALRARGRELVGLCPFHDDKSPSMWVNPDKRIYKCFACGAGGDAFSFVMDYHKMSFPEALKFLADRANIKLPRYSGGGTEDDVSPRQRILQVNAQAREFFRRTLQDSAAGAAARAYIAKRGISQEMVELFQLGAAADEWDALARHATSRKWDLPSFEQGGLIAPRDRGEGHYDKLRHRLIFPILDNLGRPLAFGGRILPGSQRGDQSDAKYLNSPETPAFNKSATLFGLHAAQKPIIDSRTAVIVEGYIDVIACHQAGVRHVVATLGTSLTSEHARVLRRYCDRVVLVFDGDEAGQKAADRALGTFFTEPIDIAIAVLPDGLDPADLLLQDGGREQWDAAIHGAVDAMTFQFARVRSQFDSVNSVAGRQRVAEEYLRKLVQLGIDQLDRQRYGLVFAQVAQLLGMGPGAVSEQLRKLSPRRAESEPAAPAATPITRRGRAERHLVGAMLNQPDLFEVELSDGRPLSETLVADDFVDGGARAVFAAVSDWLHEHHELHPADFREAFEDDAILRLALEFQMEADRLTESRSDRLEEQVKHNARALLAERAEREYEQQKVEMRENVANDSALEVEAQRWAAIRPHLNAHQAARLRVPRVVGTE